MLKNKGKTTLTISLEDLQYIYFIGIGGIGMSALARWFHHNKKKVSGYDKTSTPLTKKLEEEGISVHYEDNLDLISEQVKQFPDETLVVITPAIPASHSEWLFFQRNGYTILKRAAVLGLITRSLKTIAVAGTHGKTTTSTMIAHLLKEGGINCTAFLGGISANFNSNLLINDTANKNEVWAIVEADEFDRSFLYLHPDVAVITSTDADHLDIYGEKAELEKSFGEFASQVKEWGRLYAQNNISQSVKKVILEDEKDIELISYGYESSPTLPFSATNVQPHEKYKDACRFDFIDRTDQTPERINDFHLFMPGFHNVENMCVAIAVAKQFGISTEKLRKSVKSFKGVKRRFEYIFRGKKIIYIDDYAHHPTEISALLSSVKHLYPKKRVTVVFQPHLYSRTRDFQEGFAESLSLADELILLHIYPARELPIEGITSQIILDKTKAKKKSLVADEELFDVLEKIIRNNETDILLTVGAGDIDRFVAPIYEMIDIHSE